MIFDLQEAGGFLFHLLGCEECGKTEAVVFDTLEHEKQALREAMG
jgi:hypothetical protein